MASPSAFCWGNEDGTFQPKVDYPIGQFARFLVVGDFNGDQKPDLLVRDSAGLGDNQVLGRARYRWHCGRYKVPAREEPFSILSRLKTEN